MTTYWWLKPSHVVLTVVLPLSLFAFTASNMFYARFGAMNVISGEEYFLLLMSIMSFAGASWAGEMLRPARPTSTMPRLRPETYQVILLTLAFAAIGGTVLMLAPFALQPALVLSVLKGDPGAAFEARLQANQISGLTSLSNLLGLVIVLMMAKQQLTGYPRGKVERMLFFVMLLIVVFKVILHTERLALIELLVPMAILAAGTRRRAPIWSIAPVLSVIALVALFTGTEYLRSWVAYYAGRSDSLLGFALDRMLAYYATSINNGAFIYNIGHAYFFPIFTGEWMWHLPIDDLRVLLQTLAGPGIDLPNLLDLQYAEFNNTSGLFAPLIDFGPVLGVFTWMVLGFISGSLYRRFADGHYLGLILFPTWYIGLLEMPRIFYWGDNRYFPPLVISLGMCFVLLYLLPPRFAGIRRSGGSRFSVETAVSKGS